jgi:hypothetical protein
MRHICKHASTTIELLLEAVFSIRSTQHVYKEENLDNQLSWEFKVGSPVELCNGGWEDTTWAWKAEESLLLEAVARERLMTQQAGKSLTGSVVICELWNSAIAL